MINNEKGFKKSIFYLFLILFFGWIITEFILINKNYLTIKNNEITGLAFQVDPITGLGNLFSYEINIGSDNYPVWAILIAFAIVFSIMFNGAKLLNFFKSEENSGPAVIFAIGVSLITIFTTPTVSWILIIAAYIGAFGTVGILLIFGFLLYLWAHRTVSENITEINKAATNRQTARNDLITARNQQSQAQQRPGFFRRVLGGNPQQQAQQNQPQAQQQNQALAAQWHHLIQQALQSLNLLNNDLNHKQNWSNSLGYISQISLQLPANFQNIRMGNLNQLLNQGQRRMQQFFNPPKGQRNNNIQIANARKWIQDVQNVLNLIDGQIP